MLFTPNAKNVAPSNRKTADLAARVKAAEWENIVENLLDQAEAWRKRIAAHRESAPVFVPAALSQGAQPMIFG